MSEYREYREVVAKRSMPFSVSQGTAPVTDGWPSFTKPLD
jgi:hypothetical protein